MDGVERQTDSRVALATGLQRRDVVRLRGPESIGTDGAPLPLPRTGEAPSFEALARAVRPDLHPRTMLDQPEVAGTVRVDGDTFHKVKRSYAPGGGSGPRRPTCRVADGYLS